MRFLARAQAFVTDVHQYFSGTRWGQMAGLEQLTARSDHRLAQALQAAGVLLLNTPLALRIDGGRELHPGTLEMIELRACSVWAVHLLRQGLAASGITSTSDALRNRLLSLSTNGHVSPAHREAATAH